MSTSLRVAHPAVGRGILSEGCGGILSWLTSPVSSLPGLRGPLWETWSWAVDSATRSGYGFLLFICRGVDKDDGRG
ncbi:hypothetical protein BHE74_00012230 [Ensete ventricosum]|nr:hypothetical protein BHE74_00012230 [Ensete ventricosum]